MISPALLTGLLFGFFLGLLFAVWVDSIGPRPR